MGIGGEGFLGQVKNLGLCPLDNIVNGKFWTRNNGIEVVSREYEFGYKIT